MLLITFSGASAWAQSQNYNIDSLSQKLRPMVDSLKNIQNSELRYTYDSLHEYTNLNRLKDSLKIIAWADSMTIWRKCCVALLQRYSSGDSAIPPISRSATFY